MRIWLPLFLLLLMPAAGYAQSATLDHIDVTEYGIYTANVESTQASTTTAAGAIATLGDINHAVTTRTIPAQKGVRFGFRFVVVGTPKDTVVGLKFVSLYPPPGILNPSTQEVKTRGEYNWNSVIGATSFKAYTFDNDWEVVPGTWTFQIWYEGRKLAEQSFNIVKQ